MFFFKAQIARLRRRAIRDRNYESADKISQILDHPIRVGKDGNEVNCLALLHERITKRVQEDESVSAEIKASVRLPKFDWKVLWKWLLDHLPEIIQFIVAILSLFAESGSSKIKTKTRTVADLNRELYNQATIHQQHVLARHEPECMLILEVLMPKLPKAKNSEDLYCYGEVRIQSGTARSVLPVMSHLLWSWYRGVPTDMRERFLQDILLNS